MRFAAALIRGGNWNNGARAGVFSLNLNNSPSNANYNIGLRGARNLSWPKLVFYGRSASSEGLKRLLKVPLPAQAAEKKNASAPLLKYGAEGKADDTVIREKEYEK